MTYGPVDAIQENPVPRMTIPVPANQPTFAHVDRCNDLYSLNADIAIIGVPSSIAGSRFPSSTAPAAIRSSSERSGRFRGHVDMDFGGDTFAGRDVRIVDCGDVTMTPGEFAANSATTTAAICMILDRGAVPFVLGGDHAIPIPVLQGYKDRDAFCIVQIDAHLDFRDEVNGVAEGLSSNMRRASEMPWVDSIAQVGLRDTGSAREQEYTEALDWGAVHITAAEIHRKGVEAAITRIPTADRYYITLDIDGLDPSIAPGVIAPAFGGLTYGETFDLIRGVAAKGKIVGFDVCEVVPELDVRSLTSLLAARFVMGAIGAMAWEGQIGD